MMLPELRRLVLSLAVGFAFLALAAPEARAQARRASAPQPAAAAAREKVVIKKIEGLGTAGRIKTPEYNVNVNETPPASRDWARVLLRFETESEWIDELEFRFYVQVRNQRTQTERRFPGTFTYLDIPRGKHHLVSVFLRPATVERYGDVVGVAVEVYARGELVAVSASPEAPQGWWRAPTIKEVPGVLLERSQTPFALVAYDAYVTAKPR